MKIEHECPQCGAPVVLDETDRVLSCLHCRVRLCLTAKDCFKYRLPALGTSQKDLTFIPYWRFKGLSFICKSLEVTERVIDTSFLALRSAAFPGSQGLRTQSMGLKFAAPIPGCRYFAPTYSFKESPPPLEYPDEQNGRVYHREFIGEILSLIYAPVYFKSGLIMDAVTDRPLGKAGQMEGQGLIEDSEAWNISFLPALCPNCGWDLKGEKDSCVQACTNCSSAWESSQGELKKIDFQTIDAEENKEVVYLPFWRTKAGIEGVNLETYADLIQLSNLPRAVQKAWEEQGFYFWSPAFKLSPKIFLRLCKQFTLFQPKVRSENIFPGSTYPVTLPSREAAETVKVALAHMAADKRNLFPKLSQIRTSTRECVLTYVPFVQTPLELVHTQLSCSIPNASLTFGRRL